jgi:hypothetical protein
LKLFFVCCVTVTITICSKRILSLLPVRGVPPTLKLAKCSLFSSCIIHNIEEQQHSGISSTSKQLNTYQNQGISTHFKTNHKIDRSRMDPATHERRKPSKRSASGNTDRNTDLPSGYGTVIVTRNAVKQGGLTIVLDFTTPPGGAGD